MKEISILLGKRGYLYILKIVNYKEPSVCNLNSLMRCKLMMLTCLKISILGWDGYWTLLRIDKVMFLVPSSAPKPVRFQMDETQFAIADETIYFYKLYL